MKTLTLGVLSSLLGAIAFALLAEAIKTNAIPVSDRAFYGGGVGIAIALGVFLVATRLLGPAGGGLPRDAVVRLLLVIAFLAWTGLAGLIVGDVVLVVTRRYLTSEWCSFASADRLTITFASLPMFAAVLAGQLLLIRSSFTSEPHDYRDPQPGWAALLDVPFTAAAFILPFALAVKSVWVLATFAVPGFADAISNVVTCPH